MPLNEEQANIVHTLNDIRSMQKMIKHNIDHYEGVLKEARDMVIRLESRINMLVERVDRDVRIQS